MLRKKKNVSRKVITHGIVGTSNQITKRIQSSIKKITPSRKVAMKKMKIHLEKYKERNGKNH